MHIAVPKHFKKPRFLDTLKAVLTEEGLVSFECKVVGSPTPLLRWFKDGQELRPGDVYQLTGTNSLGKILFLLISLRFKLNSKFVQLLGVAKLSLKKKKWKNVIIKPTMRFLGQNFWKKQVFYIRHN